MGSDQDNPIISALVRHYSTKERWLDFNVVQSSAKTELIVTLENDIEVRHELPHVRQEIIDEWQSQAHVWAGRIEDRKTP